MCVLEMGAALGCAWRDNSASGGFAKALARAVALVFNLAMAYEPRTPICRTCNQPFAKTWKRQTHCSFRCAYWSKVEKRGPDECWPWIGGLVNGYGAGTYGSERYKVSREILSEKLGRPIREGFQALHTCDNPACCNPAHLWEGTPKQNMEDKCAKGRWKGESPCLKGEGHGRAVLTQDQVAEIWKARGAISYGKLADRYGVSKGTIHNIMRGTNWGWFTATL